MKSGNVAAIFLASRHGDLPSSVPSAELVAGLGVRGDRHFAETPGQLAADQELTLIQAEAIDYVRDRLDPRFEPAEARRNILTHGIDLDRLIGMEFSIGTVRVRGIRPCHPCAHLEGLTRQGVLKTLVNRGGLRAQILSSGMIRVDDPIVAPAEFEPSSEPGTATNVTD
jgi:MOSC domain-containing protein YiiM